MRFQAIYFGAVSQSIELAREDGPYAPSMFNAAPPPPSPPPPYTSISYSSFQGSPASQGQLQFDMWGVKPRYGLQAKAKLLDVTRVTSCAVFDGTGMA